MEDREGGGGFHLRQKIVPANPRSHYDHPAQAHDGSVGAVPIPEVQLHLHRLPRLREGYRRIPASRLQVGQASRFREAFCRRGHHDRQRSGQRPHPGGAEHRGSVQEGQGTGRQHHEQSQARQDPHRGQGDRHRGTGPAVFQVPLPLRAAFCLRVERTCLFRGGDGRKGSGEARPAQERNDRCHPGRGGDRHGDHRKPEGKRLPGRRHRHPHRRGARGDRPRRVGDASARRPHRRPDPSRRRCGTLLRESQEDGHPDRRCPPPHHRQARRGEILQGRHRPHRRRVQAPPARL
ncbi:MAG: hypothetical protein A4E73_02107 [Syntrophaceae bacterium PtaU1.Bin231]|nr:MAG: hypothetical protein A4E73_02107 [Syntrophaceae bacterium PtaU1.Bin231]